MSESTKEQLDQLNDLAKAATRLPWSVAHRDIRCTESDDERAGLGLEIEGPPEASNRGQFARSADARYIVAACNAVPDLIAQIRRLEREADEFRPAIESMTAIVKNIEGRWAAAEKRAEEAEAIVAKLPKTADGVPIAPGMKLYPKEPLDGDEHDHCEVKFIEFMSGAELDSSECPSGSNYSSPEAAAKARHAAPAEGRCPKCGRVMPMHPDGTIGFHAVPGTNRVCHNSAGKAAPKARHAAPAVTKLCEHGIPDGDWCEACNAAHKRARREAGYEDAPAEGAR